MVGRLSITERAQSHHLVKGHAGVALTEILQLRVVTGPGSYAHGHAITDLVKKQFPYTGKVWSHA